MRDGTMPHFIDIDKHLFGYHHPYVAAWIISSNLWNLIERGPVITAATKDGQFVFIDWCVLQFDDLTDHQDIAFAFREHAYILTMNRLIFLPLADTLYDLTSYKEIAQRIATKFGGDVVDVMTTLPDEVVFSSQKSGLELGVL